MSYSIKEARTMEVLADNLSHDNAIEMLRMYQDILGYDVIMTESIGYSCSKCKRDNMQNAYKLEHIHYFAKLQEMGNLL